MEHLGKSLVFIGIAIAVAGAALMFFNKLPFSGRLPGDIVIHKKNFTFYFPLATSLILSIIFSLVLYLLRRK
ncbi:MAG: DUF2905 domain-containing protein [Nitrospirae bacterium]|nr:DUF2905 domain-containing protein [Nitrospirota bacterium]